VPRVSVLRPENAHTNRKAHNIVSLIAALAPLAPLTPPAPLYPVNVHPVLFHIGVILIPSYGAIGALGVLSALFLAQRTARPAGANPAHVWNLSILAVFAALAGQRLTLIIANWSSLRLHPAWALGLAMVHHPLLTGAGAVAAIAVSAWYIRRHRMPVLATADALAAPLALGLAFEQFGALLAGSGFGTDANPKLPWAVTYTSTLAYRWSGTPLGVPLHPVQAYAAIGFLTLAIFLIIWMPMHRQHGDLAGICLMGLGAVIYMTEIWRDPEGRGLIFRGALDGPQIVAVVFVIAGGFILRDRKPNFEDVRD
jgi:phosphatidylglycerol---prolipoprotein diacylglyceryl transferase